MEQRPLEIVRQDGCVRWIGPAKCHIGESDGMFFPYLDVTEELAREFAVTLLRKEAIRLWRLVWEHDGDSRSSKLDAFQKCAKVRAAQDAWETVTILEAKIKQFVETGIWPEPLRGGGE